MFGQSKDIAARLKGHRDAIGVANHIVVPTHDFIFPETTDIDKILEDLGDRPFEDSGGYNSLIRICDLDVIPKGSS